MPKIKYNNYGPILNSKYIKPSHNYDFALNVLPKQTKKLSKGQKRRLRKKKYQLQ